MNGREPNLIELKWLNLVKQLPCVVCRRFHDEADSPSEIHHLDGQSRPMAHLQTIPLCAKHHRHKDNDKPPRWISRHGDGKNAFEDFYIDETGLLLDTIDQVKLLRERTL